MEQDPRHGLWGLPREEARGRAYGAEHHQRAASDGRVLRFGGRSTSAKDPFLGVAEVPDFRLVKSITI